MSLIFPTPLMCILTYISVMYCSTDCIGIIIMAFYGTSGLHSYVVTRKLFSLGSHKCYSISKYSTYIRTDTF